MMIPIKIQCGCGQRYAFDVEAAAEFAPNSVACPVCGMDGTAAANAAIVQNLSAQAAVAAAPAAGPRIRLSVPTPSAPPAAANTPTSAPPPRRPRPGQLDPVQAQHEARAKIFWGDPPEAIIGYLLMQGFSHEEASGLVREMFQERAATVRANGVRKILTGIGLVAVPIVALIIFLSIGVIPLKIFAVTVAVGLWGIWMLVNGIIMFLAPKSQPGDLADQ